MPDGPQFDRMELDEVGDDRPRRELIIRRADGSTYSASFPDTDLGDVLAQGEVVAHDAGTDENATGGQQP